MPTYLSPGVYVEEVEAGSRPIEGVGTAVAAFVGLASRGPTNAPTLVTNWSQFTAAFGDFTEGTYLAHAVYGFFLNGGNRCYVVNVGSGSIMGGGRTRSGITVLEEIDEIAIVAAPGYTDAASYDAVISHCEKMKDRVGILDAPQQVESIDALTQVATAGPTTTGRGRRSEESAETPPASTGLRARQSDGGYAAYYFPWIVVRDPLAPEQQVTVPPSGHIAGIWARTDMARGVHKAPANEAVRGALDLSYRLTREEQGVLNQQGVNGIRLFSREGIRVWGARTLAASGSEWRYLNVRRLFNMIEEAIADNTRWIVFEPNDRTLWKSIRRDIGAFLTRLWRDGALMGRTPEEAFFVKCDEETNPPEVIDAGQVVAVIGIAPVKPAEFIIFRISQYASGVETETLGGGSV